jgi:hypothetical protein
MDQDHLFPEARRTLEEAVTRHADVWDFALEAIALAHLANERRREFDATIVPGVPRLRRIRNDINDDCWRFFKVVAGPLQEDGRIREFAEADGGEVMILPDGLHTRLKKGDAAGATSNYPTPKVSGLRRAANQQVMYPGTELDRCIMGNVGIDVVFVAGRAMGEYKRVGLRFAMAESSPFVVMEAPTPARLLKISPAGSELATDLRSRLTA